MVIIEGTASLWTANDQSSIWRISKISAQIKTVSQYEMV